MKNSESAYQLSEKNFAESSTEISAPELAEGAAERPFSSRIERLS
jgi:hypothetical protein